MRSAPALESARAILAPIPRVPPVTLILATIKSTCMIVALDGRLSTVNVGR